MKISHEEPKVRNDSTIGGMKPGQYGIDKNVRYYYRTLYSAACLNDVGASFCMRTIEQMDQNNTPITILPKGTIIKIEVE